MNGLKPEEVTVASERMNRTSAARENPISRAFPGFS
jgi:hypothetical protein